MPPDLTIVCLECREQIGNTRGLCDRCYDRLSKRVRAGQTTWRELETAGRARAARGTPWRSKRP